MIHLNCKLNKIDLLPFRPDGWEKLAVLATGLVGVYLFIQYTSYKEISWKEFYSNFLERGIVIMLLLMVYIFILGRSVGGYK